MSKLAINTTRIVVDVFIGAAQSIEKGLLCRMCSSSEKAGGYRQGVRRQPLWQNIPEL